MINIKVITLCGSKKFTKEFERLEISLAKQGYAVLMPVFGKNLKLNEDEIKLFGKIHLKKIALADEIFIVDVDGYIGESTKKEIEYARSLGKEIRYYSKETL